MYVINFAVLQGLEGLNLVAPSSRPFAKPLRCIMRHCISYACASCTAQSAMNQFDSSINSDGESEDRSAELEYREEINSFVIASASFLEGYRSGLRASVDLETGC